MIFRSVALLSLSLLSFSLQAQQKPASPTLFTVNKRSMVSVDEFIYLYKKNHQHADDYTAVKVEEYLNLFINFKLKVEEARRRGMDTTTAFRQEYNQYKDELRKPYLPDAKLTDSLVRLTFQRLQEEINASHILISVKADATPEDTLRAYQKALALRKRIVGGEDFGKVAAETSEDPSAQLNKGNLGYFTALQMVFPFESAAYATPKGSISMPVRTRFGYHLIQVIDRRPARGEVEVAHIMRRTGDDKNNEQAKNTIFDIFDELQAGMNWDDLCREYSEDPGSKDNGGKLKPFGVGVMGSTPAFEATAFQLEKPGDISDPFQTQYGWHIVKLIRRIPLPTLEEQASVLKNRVNRDERTQISKKAFQAGLRKEYTFEESTATKARVMALADTALLKGHWKKPAFANADKEKLFSLQGKTYPVSAFLDYVLKNQRPNSQTPQNYLDQLYNNFVDASIMERLEENLIRTHPDYGFLLTEYYEGILLFGIMEKEVWDRASQDSTGQRRYYEAHRNDYQTGERVKATLFYASHDDFIAPLESLIAEGKEKEATDFAQKNKVKWESGYFKKDDKAVLQKVSWAKGIYTVENNGMYYLAWLRDILPAGSMSFEEARPNVISDYQNALEKDWVSKLRKQYKVKVDSKGKADVLKQLKK